MVPIFLFLWDLLFLVFLFLFFFAISLEIRLCPCCCGIKTSFCFTPPEVGFFLEKVGTLTPLFLLSHTGCSAETVVYTVFSECGTTFPMGTAYTVPPLISLTVFHVTLVCIMCITHPNSQRIPSTDRQHCIHTATVCFLPQCVSIISASVSWTATQEILKFMTDLLNQGRRK